MKKSWWYLRVTFLKSLLPITLLFYTMVACKDDSEDALPEAVVNTAPTVTSVTSTRSVLCGGDTTTLVCNATDAEGDTLAYLWTTNHGSLTQDPAENRAVLRASESATDPHDTTTTDIMVTVNDSYDEVHATVAVSVVNGDLWEDTGEPFVDEMDSSGSYNGVFDAEEPWVDRANEFGVNNVGVYDPWDPFLDLNANGYWDAGEQWFDLPSGFREDGLPRGVPQLNYAYDGPNGEFDEYELFTISSNQGPDPDPRVPVVYTWQDLLNADHASFDWLTDQPGVDPPAYLMYQPGFSTWTDRNVDGVFSIPVSRNESSADAWYDTGEPFIDTPDMYGDYNHEWDPGEVWLDLPSAYYPYGPRGFPTRNGRYDGPNSAFDEYELFTIISSTDLRLPVVYTWANILEEIPFGEPAWMFLPPLPGGHPGYFGRIPDRSTWIDRNGNGRFDIP
ncbi:MAG: hypothetical protein IPG71_00380 [bacterium]|nr:hypothetical protein [bacterium]